MRVQTFLALAVLLIANLSCGSRSPTAPAATSRLQVLVYWNDQGLPDRRLEIVELGLVRSTNSAGIAVFSLPAGNYTLRAFVNSGGGAAFLDIAVSTRPGETAQVTVADCLPCVGPS